MPMIRFRLTGSRYNADDMMTALHGITDVERVEEVDDLMPAMRDDSSSSESVSDSEGQVYCIEVEAPDAQVADSVRALAEAQAREMDAGIEFTDTF